MLRNKLLALALIISFGACSPRYAMAPRGKVPTRQNLPQFSNGAWININNGIQGELIAVGDQVVWYLDNAAGLQSIPREDINSAVAVLHRNSTGHYAIWSVAGGISTISNGVFLIFTFPMWVIGGIGTVTAESRRGNYVHYPGYAWDDIGKFARFPQGLPDGIALDRIE